MILSCALKAQQEGDNIPYISPEHLARIKQIDLLTYLKQNEPNELVKLSANTYCTRSHDSLKISNGMWKQWSTGIGGRSALDYLIKIRGMSLPDAALAIEGTVLQPSLYYARDAPKAIMSDVHLPERSESNDKAIGYLLSRGIDRSIITELVGNGRIYEERKHHNVVFVGVDSTGTPKHAAIRATSSSRFMLDAPGSDKCYSFSLEGSSESRRLHVFESAIDLLSFCTFEKMSGHDWRAEHLLSLSGISNDERAGVPDALRKYLSEHPTIAEVYLHLDNDKAGRIATKAIISELPNEYRCYDKPSLYGKDYNDFLNQRLSIKKRSDAR